MHLNTRRKWILAVASFFIIVSAAAPATLACTGLRLIGKDGTTVFGRTQEWGKFDLHAQAVVVPKGWTFKSDTPDGKTGYTWKANYGLVGILLMNRVINTGMNEKGLAGGMFYHDGFAEYAKYNQTRADVSLDPALTLSYILSNFADLQEVREGMEHVDIVPVVTAELNKPFPLHVMLAEPGGASIVIEFKDGRPKIFDNPVGAIANNPTFDWHLTNLRNYGKLSLEPFKAQNWGDLEITPLAGGSGFIGLPGDFTSPSRFIRAVVFGQTARSTKGGLDTVQEFFRIMDSFNLGAKQAEGADASTESGMPAGTQYTIANDTKNRVMYYHTMFNRRIRKIDLKQIDFARGKMRAIPLDEKRVQDIEEVTGKLR